MYTVFYDFISLLSSFIKFPVIIIVKRQKALPLVARIQMPRLRNGIPPAVTLNNRINVIELNGTIETGVSSPFTAHLVHPTRLVDTTQKLRTHPKLGPAPNLRT